MASLGKSAHVGARWDAEEGVWIATSTDIPGLVLAAARKDDLLSKIELVAGDLLRSNLGSEHGYSQYTVRFGNDDVTRTLDTV